MFMETNVIVSDLTITRKRRSSVPFQQQEVKQKRDSYTILSRAMEIATQLKGDLFVDQSLDFFSKFTIKLPVTLKQQNL